MSLDKDYADECQSTCQTSNSHRSATNGRIGLGHSRGRGSANRRCGISGCSSLNARDSGRSLDSTRRRSCKRDPGKRPRLTSLTSKERTYNLRVRGRTSRSRTTGSLNNRRCTGTSVSIGRVYFSHISVDTAVRTR